MPIRKKVTRRVTFFYGIIIDIKRDAKLDLICVSVALMKFNKNNFFLFTYNWMILPIKRFMPLLKNNINH